MPNSKTSSPPVISSLTDTTSIQDDADFQTRLNNLPLEIFELVEDLTISGHIALTCGASDLSSPGGQKRHTSNLKILQLSHAIRRQHAKEFYSVCTFQVRTDKALLAWLTSVDVKHRDFIVRVEYVLPIVEDPVIFRFMCERIRIEISSIGKLAKFGPLLETRMYGKFMSQRDYDCTKE